MPITWLDILLLGVMLISGLLAMIRGFMREILSITAWAAAAVGDAAALPPPAADREGQHLERHRGDRRRDRRRVPDHAADRLDHHRAHLRHDPRQPDRRARPHPRLPVRARPRPDHRRGRLPVLLPGWCRATSSPTASATPSRAWCWKSTGEWLQALLPQDMDNYLSQWFKKRPKGDEQDTSGCAARSAFRCGTPAGHRLAALGRPTRRPTGPTCVS